MALSFAPSRQSIGYGMNHWNLPSREIIAISDHLKDVVAQIATVAFGQEKTTEGVSSRVEEIARFCSESASGAKQAAKACQDLSQLAVTMESLVRGFHLDDRTSHGAKRVGQHGISPAELIHAQSGNVLVGEFQADTATGERSM
jgi:hypothetical protein